MPSNLDHFPHPPPRQHPVDAAQPAKPSLFGKIRIALKVRSAIQDTMKTKSSWKTTLGGILSAALLVVPMLPQQWQWIATTIAGIGGLLTGVTARQNDVTSEQAGAK